MELIVNILTVIVIIAYIGIAGYFIFTRERMRNAVIVSIGFILGGIVIIPVAHFIATVVTYILAGALVVLIFAGLFSMAAGGDL